MTAIIAVLVLGFAAYFLYYARTEVPDGFVGFDGRNILDAGKHLTFYRVRLIDMRPRVHTFAFVETPFGGTPKVSPYVVTWIPDRRNLENFLRHASNDEEFQLIHSRAEQKFQSILGTLRTADLEHHAPLLGMKFLRIEKEAERARSQGIRLGEGVEVPD